MLYPSRIETLDDLRAIMSAAQVTRTLQIAHHIGVFDALGDGEQDLEALTASTSTPAATLEPLLTACCAIGLLDRDGDRFRNTPLAAEHLVPGKPLYQGNMIGHGMDVWTRWNGLPHRYRPDHGDASWAAPEDFILAMHNITVPDRGPALAQDVDLSDRRNLIDIGGGPGTYSIYACKAYPKLHATVWDLPATIAIARTVVERFPEVADRMSFIAGDWNEDDFGSGYDALLMSNVMHGMSSDPESKLAKAFAALDPGGLIIIQDFILNDDRTGPISAALFNLYIGAFTFAELGDLLRAAGFTDVSNVRVPEIDGCGVVTAVKPLSFR
jgi:SAM-dependent methyltransferase